MMSDIVVAANSPDDVIFAENQAHQFGLSFVKDNYKLSAYPAYLLCEKNNTRLCFSDQSLKPMTINFGDNDYQKRLIKFKQNLLVRACGLDKQAMTIIDATAGFAYDSWVLANAGGRMHLIEETGFLACLLHQSLQAIQTLPISSFLSLYHGNAIALIPQIAKKEKAEVIYLDPMFPERQKSAAVKKPMQILQNLLPEPSDESTLALFDIAWQFTQDRVVVKRPKNAGFLLNNLKPNHSIAGKLCRFDVYKKGR